MGFEKVFNDFSLNPATAKAGDATKAYRKEAMKWHPDKWTTKGTPEEKAEAAEKFKEWNSKYDLFNSLFEENLDESRQGDLANALLDTPRAFLEALLLENPNNIKQKHEIKNALNHVYSFEELESLTKKDWTVFPAEQKEKIERSLKMTSYEDSLARQNKEAPQDLKALWSSALNKNSEQAIEAIFYASQKFNTTEFKTQVNQISNLFESKAKIKADLEKFVNFLDDIPFWLNETNNKRIAEIAEKSKSMLSSLSRSELDALLIHFDDKPDIIQVLNLVIEEKEKEFVNYINTSYSEQSAALLTSKDWSALDNESQEEIIKVFASDLKKTLMLYKNPLLSESNKKFIVEKSEEILKKSVSSKLEKANMMVDFGKHEEAIKLFSKVAIESVKTIVDIETVKQTNAKRGRKYTAQDKDLDNAKTDLAVAKQSLDKIQHNKGLRTTLSLAKLDIYIAERKIEPERPWYKLWAPTRQQKINAAKDYKDYLENPTKVTLEKLKSHRGWFGALNDARLGDIVEKQGGIPKKPPSQLAETARDLGVDPNRPASTQSQQASTKTPTRSVVPPVQHVAPVAVPEPLAPADEKAIVPASRLSR